MSLHTTCPHCHSIFRVSEQQLAAADGWVQCGLCAAPFDALAGLPEEKRTEYLTPPAPQPAPTAEVPAGEPVASAIGPEQVGAPPALEPAGEIPAAAPLPAAPEPPAPPGPHLPGLERRIAEETAEEMAEAEGPHPSDLPSIIILDPDAKVPEDYGPLPIIPAEHAAYDDAAVELEDDDEEEGEEQIAKAASPAIVSRPTPSEPAPAASPAPARRRTGWLWVALPLLVLLLLGQLIYFLHDPLMANYPGLRPMLSSVCDLLGCQLGLPQNVEKIKILGSDLQAEPGNGKRLTLALTLANQASYAQAWPMLQLSLTDTKDNPLARRLFAPSEYLTRPGMLEAGIPALSETPLSLHLETRDVNASGFRVEAFY
jgi:predicted Zn finger-like uncharacterized protein